MAWPIVDRWALRAAIDACLDATPPRSVLLRGPSGIGKTVLARGVAEDRARTGNTALSVVGLTELRDSPLTAFVPVMAELRSPAETAALTAPDVIATVGALGRAALLVVDDAPLLDDASAAVVYHLVRAYAVPTVLTARAGHLLTGAVERLLHEDLVAEIPVPGLTRAEMDELLRGRFQAPPRPDDLGRLEEATAGNPLHLRQVVDLAEQWGLTRVVPAGVEIDPIRTPLDLDASVAERVSALNAEELRVLRAITVCPGVRAETLLPGASDRAVAADLQRQGFVTLRPDGVLRPAHPAYGEAATAGLDDRARSALVVDLAGRIGHEPDPDQRFAAIRLLTRNDVDPSAADLAWAVRRAYAMGEHVVATELAERASGPLPFAAELDAATSYSTLGRLELAEDAFARCERAAATSTERALLTSRRGNHLAYRRFDVIGALELVETNLPGLDPQDAVLVGPDLRTWRILAGQLDGHATGPSTDAPDPDAWAEDAESAGVAVRAAIAAVMLDSMSGRGGDEAARTLLEVERLHGVLDPFAADMVHLNQYFTLLAQGQGVAAEAVCADRRTRCTSDAVGMWSLTLGIHWQYGGRLTEARDVTDLAVEQLRWRDPLGLLGFAVALRALIAAQCDDAATARSALAGLRPVQLGDPKAAMLAAEARAHLRFATGDPAGASRELVESASAAAEAGHELVAAIGLGLCVRFGRPQDGLALLEEIRDRVGEGLVLYEALADAAGGLVGRDPRRVLAAAERLARAGMVTAAVDALALAERDVTGQGAAELRRKLERARATLGAASEALPLQSVEGPDGLSPREWEVAELIRQRYSSREIAGALGLSVRTVDNHLARIFRKVGVSSRAELRAALADEAG